MPGISANFGKKIKFSPGEKLAFDRLKIIMLRFSVIFSQNLLPIY
jgi:hypothetical protein